MYTESRGKELPGNYNHILLSRLFHAQSSRWPDLAVSHLDNVHHEITCFAQAALQHVIKDDRVCTNVLDSASATLRAHVEGAKKELDKLCRDEQIQPITYNHYYTDNIQNARQEALRKLLKKAMNETASQDWNGKLHVSNNTFDAAKLLSSLQSRIIVDMDAQACAEALSGLNAYYKVRAEVLTQSQWKADLTRWHQRRLWTTSADK